MKFLRKLFKDKKGSNLVEKIMVTAFAVAAGAAVIIWTSNVIIESKNKPISGILDGSGGGNSIQSQIGITKMELVINDADGYNPTFTMVPDNSNGNQYAWSYTFSSGEYIGGSGEQSYYCFTGERNCGFIATFQDNSIQTDTDSDSSGTYCYDQPLGITSDWENSYIHKIMISEDAGTSFTYSGYWEIIQTNITFGGHTYRIAYIGAPADF